MYSHQLTFRNVQRSIPMLGIYLQKFTNLVWDCNDPILFLSSVSQSCSTNMCIFLFHHAMYRTFVSCVSSNYGFEPLVKEYAECCAVIVLHHRVASISFGIEWTMMHLNFFLKRIQVWFGPMPDAYPCAVPSRCAVLIVSFYLAARNWTLHFSYYLTKHTARI